MDKPLIEVVLCGDHAQRVQEGNPCDDCPSVPANMERCLRRAQQHDLAYRASVMTSHQEHTKLLNTISSGIDSLTRTVTKLDSTLLNSYLAVASVCVFGIVSAMLWHAKITADKHFWITMIVLFPFYGKGIEYCLRVIRGEKGGENRTISLVIVTAVSVLSAYHLFHP